MLTSDSISSGECESPALLVVGAGLMRTGTSSLKIALQILLGGRCYHMNELRDEHLPFWNNVVLNKGHVSPLDWTTFFSSSCPCVAALDLPAAAFYAELMRVYPHAKVILTVRDADSWVRSIRSTTRSHILTHEVEEFPLKWLIRLFLPGVVEFRKFIKSFFNHFLPGNEDFTDAQWETFFQQWDQRVMATVPEDRLLVFRVEEGWGPLCRFLGVKEPENVPFPRVNDTKQFQDHLSKYRRLKWISWAVTGVAVIITGTVAYKFTVSAWRSNSNM